MDGGTKCSYLIIPPRQHTIHNMYIEIPCEENTSITFSHFHSCGQQVNSAALFAQTPTQNRQVIDIVWAFVLAAAGAWDC